MTRVDFYKLARAIQDRFVGSVVGGFVPVPIAAKKGGKPVAAAWLGASAASLLVLVIVMWVGFGSLDGALSRHSVLGLVLYVALTFGALGGVLYAFAHVVRVGAQPFPPGVYVFPACVVDARTDAFAVVPTTELTQVVGVGSSLRLSGPRGSFELPVADAADAAASVEAGRAALALVEQDPESADRLPLDPLVAPRFSSPVGSRVPYAPKAPPWGKHGWAVAAVAGLVLGASLWGLRNHASDGRMFAEADAAHTSEAYRKYLVNGRRHAAEVRDTLLPRAELREAEAKGTEAVLAYQASHADTKIGGEVAQAVRRVMLAELDKAKTDGQLASLERFARGYPNHGVDPELRAARHAVFARELAAWKAKASADPVAVAFVERLVAYAERAGGDVEVRIRQRPSQSLARADKHVGKSSEFMGEHSYPSKYFEGARIQKRERELTETLARVLGRNFPGQAFRFEAGAPLPSTDEPLPETVTKPTLFVTWSAEWSTYAFQSKKAPRGIFCNLTFPFQAELRIPGDAKPFKYRTEAVESVSMTVLKAEEPGTPEERHYTHMTTKAFETFPTRLVKAFVKSPEL